MSSHKLLSIIIPSYNRLEHAVSAIESALSQDFSGCGLTQASIEIIVVFDGGNKFFAEIIMNNFRGRPVDFYYKENGGVASALNFGIRKAKGKYINWLSDDDMMASNHISVFYNKLNSQTWVSRFKPTIIYGGWEIIDKNSKIIESVPPQKSQISNSSLRSNCLYPLIKSRIHGCSMWVEKSLFYRYGFFDETLKTTQDYHRWHIFIERSNLICEESTTTIHSRVHHGQDSNRLSEICNAESDELWTMFAENFMTVAEVKGFAWIDYLDVMRKHLQNSSYQSAYRNIMYISKINHPFLNIKIPITSLSDIETSYEIVYNFLSCETALSLFYYCISFYDYTNDCIFKAFTNHELIRISDGFSSLDSNLPEDPAFSLFTAEWRREITITTSDLISEEKLWKIIRSDILEICEV